MQQGATAGTHGKNEESLTQRFADFIPRMLKALVRALQGARIIKKQVDEKVNVE